MPLKTAAELGLTGPQYCWLVKTLVALEEDRLVEDHRIHFDMGTWCDTDHSVVPHGCGSVCCIGGTAELLGGPGARIVPRPPVLQKLFFPAARMENNPYEATTKQAAVALRHYLTTGKEDWKMAMETPR